MHSSQNHEDHGYNSDSDDDLQTHQTFCQRLTIMKNKVGQIMTNFTQKLSKYFIKKDGRISKILKYFDNETMDVMKEFGPGITSYHRILL